MCIDTESVAQPCRPCGNRAGLGQDAGKRARIQYKECMRRFPGSRYAQQAEQALPNVRVSRGN